MYEDPRVLVYLEVVEDAVFLHTQLFDLSSPRDFLSILHRIEDEILLKGVGLLFCLVRTDVEIRYAEFFGFKLTPYKTDEGHLIMLKDLIDG